jgi:hypothetical protein
MSIATTYAEFATREAHGVSPTYERLAHAVSRDAEILTLLATVPEPRRQPNLLFGVTRLLGGPVDDPAAFHDFLATHWPAVQAELRTRATQTNEAGRCALLLPVLATLRPPLALLEVGTAAACAFTPTGTPTGTAPTWSATMDPCSNAPSPDARRPGTCPTSSGAPASTSTPSTSPTPTTSPGSTR